MTVPTRLQLSRRKGFELQAWSRQVNGLPAVNCARPGRWGNPYEVGKLSAQQAVDQFRVSLYLHIASFPTLAWMSLEELRGKNLACWCSLAPSTPCPADVLLEHANRPICEEVG